MATQSEIGSSGTSGSTSQTGEIKKFIDLEKIPTNYSCKTCLLAFSIDVMAYLQKKHFLIIENSKILPTPLGKAAFASSIPPEES